MSMRRPSLDINVRNPVTNNKCITYEIAIRTSNPAFTLRSSTTGRKHNDFCWLRKTLKSHHPLFKPPELPVKKSIKTCDVQCLVQRMRELEDWLYSVTDVSLYLSDTTLHLFLQTDLSCRQIDQYLNGKLAEDVVTRGRRNCQCRVTADGVCTMDEKEDDEDPTTPTPKEHTKTQSPIDIANDDTSEYSHSISIVYSRTDSGIARSISETESDTDSFLDDSLFSSNTSSSINSSPNLFGREEICSNAVNFGQTFDCPGTSLHVRAEICSNAVNFGQMSDCPGTSLPVIADNVRTSLPTDHVINKPGELDYEHVTNQTGKLTISSGTSPPSDHVTQEVTKDHGKGKCQLKFENCDWKNYSIQATSDDERPFIPNTSDNKGEVNGTVPKMEKRLRVEMGVIFPIK